MKTSQLADYKWCSLIVRIEADAMNWAKRAWLVKK